MPPTQRVRPPLRRVPRGDDSGFTIVEALVSFVLLAVVAASTITAIVNATNSSKRDTDRVTAANLAQQDLQAARSLRFPNYPAARTAPAVQIGDTLYSLSRSVSTTTPGGTVIAGCPATPDFTARPYMVVTTTVTWTAAGKTSQSAAVSDKVVLATEIAC